MDNIESGQVAEPEQESEPERGLHAKCRMIL